jgi:4a-hydroxytetrahydrobiopterin dehydratase
MLLFIFKSGKIRNMHGAWQEDESGIFQTFTFDNFKQAIEFVNKVAELAEAHNHHPDIDIRYNKVTLLLITHSQGAVTDKDWQLAKEIEKLF